MSEPTLWRVLTDDEIEANVAWDGAIRTDSMMRLVVGVGEQDVTVGADAICPPRHRFNEQPCETCKARVRLVFAAVGEGDR